MPVIGLVPKALSGRHPRHIRDLRWSSPLADGLIALVTVQGGRPIEWVTGQPFTPVSSPGIRAYPGTQSQGTDTNGSNSYWRLDGSWTFNVTSTTGVSMAARWNSDASQASRWLATFGSSAATLPILGWVQSNAAGTVEVQAYNRYDSGTNSTLSSGTGGLTGDRTAVFTWDKEQWFDPLFTRVFSWVDRVKTTGPNLTSTETLTADRLALGCLLRSSPAAFFNGSVSWAAWWDRGITPYELELCWGGLVSELTDQGSRTYFIPAAAGGGATINVDGGSFTLSAGVISVDKTVEVVGGSYSLTASAINIDKTIQVGGGSYSVTAGSLSIDKTVDLTGGTFTLTAGNYTALLASGTVINVDGGTFALTAGSVDIDKTVSLSGGSFTLTPSAVNLDWNIPIGSGSYTVTVGGVQLDKIQDLSGGLFIITPGGVTWNQLGDEPIAVIKSSQQWKYRRLKGRRRK